MKLLFASLSLVVLLGITKLQASAPIVPEPSTAAPQLSVTDTEQDESALCPFQWTCDFVTFYGTKASCQASCSSACFREENCNGNCICR